jgi:hypothetical protein
MDERIHDALVELKRSIDKQNEIAEQQLATTKALIGTIQESAQVTADLLGQMVKGRKG